MKKLILSALAASGFLFVTAQPVVVGSPVTARQSASATINLRLDLDNVISLVPSYEEAYAHFTSAADYNSGGKQVLDIDNGDHSMEFYVSSNRAYNVTINGGSANLYSSSATPMPIGTVSWFVTNNNTGGMAMAGGPLTNTNVNILTGGMRGYERLFEVGFTANPGWNYDGGTYTANVVLTATQQ